MENRRQTKRVPFSAPIEQLLKHRSDYPNLGASDEFIAAKALNLSPGGMACESSSPIEPLSHVFLIFSIPTEEGERHIRCEGYVAHSRYEGKRCVFGIKFLDLYGEDRAALEAFIATAG